jgi:hypothetical protein
MKYRQAALVFLAGNALEILMAALLLPQGSLHTEATPLLIALGAVVLFTVIIFSGAPSGSEKGVLQRTVQVLVFVLGVNAVVRAALFSVSLLPGQVELIVQLKQWSGTPLLIIGPAGLPAGVKAVIELIIAVAMGRALWDWPPAAKEAKGAAGAAGGKRRTASRRSSSRA